MAYAENPYQQPGAVRGISVLEAESGERSAFLRRVAMWTAGGLSIAGAASVAMCVALMSIPLLSQRFVMMGIVFGGIFLTRAIESRVGQAPTTAAKAGWFALGQSIQGISMGYIIFAAAMLGMAQYGNPLFFIGEAILLVGLTVAGLCGYLMTGPKNLSMLGGGLSAISLPLMLAVGFTWIFPVGGIMGLMIAIGLVAVSTAGLLYNLNHVMHHSRTDMHVQSAYHIAIGVLILLWNVLSVLMRLQSRD